MLTISDSVEIAVAPGRLWQWLCALPEHYLAWHPAHRRCAVVRGRLWEPAAVVEVEEDLHGRRHHLRFRVTHVAPEREIAYRAAPWLRGRFLLAPVDAHVRFTAELTFGLPALGGIADPVLTRLFRSRIAAARDHQREEGRNLKRLLERGPTPTA